MYFILALTAIIDRLIAQQAAYLEER